MIWIPAWLDDMLFEMLFERRLKRKLLDAIRDRTAGYLINAGNAHNEALAARERANRPYPAE